MEGINLLESKTPKTFSPPKRIGP